MFFSKSLDRLWGLHSPMGAEGPLPMGDRSVPEADYLPPTSVEVKNEWSYTSTIQYTFVACNVYLKIL
jgi:hypothetical protein